MFETLPVRGTAAEGSGVAVTVTVAIEFADRMPRPAVTTPVVLLNAMVAPVTDDVAERYFTFGSSVSVTTAAGSADGPPFVAVIV